MDTKYPDNINHNIRFVVIAFDVSYIHSRLYNSLVPFSLEIEFFSEIESRINILIAARSQRL